MFMVDFIDDTVDFIGDLFSLLFAHPFIFALYVLTIIAQVAAGKWGKNKFIKVLPCIISFVISIGFLIVSYHTNGWDAIGYLALFLIFAIYFATCFLILLIPFVLKKVRAFIAKKKMKNEIQENDNTEE